MRARPLAAAGVLGLGGYLAACLGYLTRPEYNDFLWFEITPRTPQGLLPPITLVFRWAITAHTLAGMVAGFLLGTVLARRAATPGPDGTAPPAA